MPDQPATFKGYHIACPDERCDNPDAYIIPAVQELAGPERGSVRYTHRIDCHICEAAGR